MKRAEIKCQDGKAEVHIYDVIGNYWGEGISADQFRHDIEALGDVESLTVRINSPGGAVHDGITMYNALRRMTIPTVAAVDGIAASAAAIVAMGADTVLMSESANLMIHEAMGLTDGRAQDHLDMASRLETINETQAKILSDKSGVSVGIISELLTAETWFTGAEALSHGFADEVTEPLQIAACIPEGHFRHTPKALVLNSAEARSATMTMSEARRWFEKCREADPPAKHEELSPAQIARKKALDNMRPKD